MTYAEIMELAEQIINKIDPEDYIQYEDIRGEGLRGMCLSALAETFADVRYLTYEFQDIFPFIMDFLKVYYLGVKGGVKFCKNALYGKFMKEGEEE